MKLAYIYPEHLAQEKTRVLQVAATINALVQQGALVHFLVGRFKGLDSRLSELGLYPGPGLIVERLWMCQKGPGLPVPLSWHGLFHRMARSHLVRLAAQGVEIALVRHLKLADYLLGPDRVPGLKLIYEAHELFSQTAAEQGKDQERLASLRQREDRVLKNADQVIAISKPLASALQSMTGRNLPLPVAPSGVDEKFFAPGVIRERQPGLVAYAGGLEEWKGVDLLLQAISQVPQARLEVLGGLPNSRDWQRVQGLGRDLRLGERLLLRPRSSQDQVRELLGRAQVAVWPGSGSRRISAEFTSPLKLFEYLAAGCAVVAPDLPAARSVLTPDRDAVLFPADDAPALAQTINRILRDSSLAKALSREGQKTALNYTWNKRAQGILRVTREMG